MHRTGSVTQSMAVNWRLSWIEVCWRQIFSTNQYARKPRSLDFKNQAGSGMDYLKQKLRTWVRIWSRPAQTEPNNAKRPNVLNLLSGGWILVVQKQVYHSCVICKLICAVLTHRLYVKMKYKRGCKQIRYWSSVKLQYLFWWWYEKCLFMIVYGLLSTSPESSCKGVCLGLVRSVWWPAC